MSQEDYRIYAESMDDRARREIALAWFMGWLAGFTESGGQVGESDIEAAKEKVEAMFGTTLLAFGPSETNERSRA